MNVISISSFFKIEAEDIEKNGVIPEPAEIKNSYFLGLRMVLLNENIRGKRY